MEKVRRGKVPPVPRLPGCWAPEVSGAQRQIYVVPYPKVPFVGAPLTAERPGRGARARRLRPRGPPGFASGRGDARGVRRSTPRILAGGSAEVCGQLAGGQACERDSGGKPPPVPAHQGVDRRVVSPNLGADAAARRVPFTGPGGPRREAPWGAWARQMKGRRGPRAHRAGWPVARGPPPTFSGYPAPSVGDPKVVTWLILPVVICLSQRLSHASLSISNYTAKLRKAHYISYRILGHLLLLG
jgi:hypothetical protein